uniref:Uncharacterized protein n=1 Tax=Glossina austeni TaxID=7395 RepID=A0A1A9UFC3_GLOAU
MCANIPLISGTITIFLKCVLTISGFSFGGASFLALRSFFINAIGLRFKPREKRRRARLCINSTSWLLKTKIVFCVGMITFTTDFNRVAEEVLFKFIITLIPHSVNLDSRTISEEEVNWKKEESDGENSESDSFQQQRKKQGSEEQQKTTSTNFVPAVRNPFAKASEKTKGVYMNMVEFYLIS